MKLGKKELVIIIPMIIVSIVIVVTSLIPVQTDDPFASSDQWWTGEVSSCQEGWFKYELESGTLCSKSELTESQLEEYNG